MDIISRRPSAAIADEFEQFAWRYLGEEFSHLRMNTSGGEDTAFQDSGQTNMFIEGFNGNVVLDHVLSPGCSAWAQCDQGKSTGNDYVNAGVVLQANDNDDYRGYVYMQNMQATAVGTGNPYLT